MALIGKKPLKYNLKQKKKPCIQLIKKPPKFDKKIKKITMRGS